MGIDPYKVENITNIGTSVESKRLSREEMVD
jgi:hypothetical protein